MKKISPSLLKKVVKNNREKYKISQVELAEKTDINRAMISKLESGKFIPSIEQLNKLEEVLHFDIDNITTNDEKETKKTKSILKLEHMNIAVAGTGYVGLSIACLLSQHNTVKAVDIIPEKVEMINNKKSPIQDEYIEDYLSNKNLDLEATLDAKAAYSNADYVVVAAPTNYDPQKNYFDTSAVEKVIDLVIEYNPNAYVVIKSTIPVGFTSRMRKEKNFNNILFSPEFLRESKALYDNLYPSRIIVGTDLNDEKQVKAAETFASLLKQGAIKQNISSSFSAMRI